MTIEIHRPELEALIMERMKTGGFNNVEDALQQALETSPVVVTDAATAPKRPSVLALISSRPCSHPLIEKSRLSLHVIAYRCVTLRSDAVAARYQYPV